MRKSSLWLRFACCLGFTLLLFAGTWFYQHAETPPWADSKRAVERADPPSQPNRAKPKQHSGSFRFVSYNLKNWLSSSQTPEKSRESKLAIIDVLTSGGADIVGLSEIGSEADVKEVQKLLKQAGHDLPYFHHTGGSDPVRHLAIVSRFPIVSIQQPVIDISGTQHSLQRGMIDVEIEINSQIIRFIGIHLKSKRIVADYDEAELRVREAEHVRKHIDAIFSKNPDARLIAYGDFNDHVQSLSTKTILGNYRSPFYLTPVETADGKGEKWTYHFGAQDSYNRIDFITVSKNLKPQVDKTASRIIDIPSWELASDHRAVMVSFK